MSVNHFQESLPRKKPNTFPLTYVGILAVFVYVIWIVALSVYGQTKNQKILKQKESDLEQVQLQAEIKQKFIEYQKTDNYIELQAREHFGYARPGETIVILPEKFRDTGIQTKNQTRVNAQQSEKVVVSNPRLWWQYFFGKK